MRVMHVQVSMAAINHASSEVLAQRRDVEKLKQDFEAEAAQFREQIAQSEQLRTVLGQHGGVAPEHVSSLMDVVLALTGAETIDASINIIRDTFTNVEALEHDISTCHEEISRLSSEGGAASEHVLQLQAQLTDAVSQIAQLERDAEVRLHHPTCTVTWTGVERQGLGAYDGGG